jgi:hypothetical protein|uniref:Uncharacterized protein n=1 Tax=Myoviridae sp. ct5ra14 TaxID=2827659 RepID=A0A8S5T200_9CAUD|nr:MAG TPA: hypothetical protein [Myoviridae sp. ct5ra14]
MLKELIELFAEKFLFNRKSWVSNQSLPSNLDKAVSIGSVSNKFGEGGSNNLHYVAPADGWVFTFTNDASGVCDTSLNTSSGMHMGVIGNDWVRLCIPVSKGQQVGIYAQSKTGAPVPFGFCPSNGSSD